MKICVVIPTRGNRPEFLENAKRLLSLQTRQPDFTVIVDDEPESDAPDIVYRYRKGCEEVFIENPDAVFFWEDDDWYHPDYLKLMIDKWVERGCPDIFGINSTLYYQIKLRKWRLLKHPKHSSAMNMLITNKALDIKWDLPNSFLDLFLWKRFDGISHDFDRILSIGIKHGIGLCGGKGHRIFYPNSDPDWAYLESIVGEKDLEFYERIGGQGE